jgi:probable F420-dependent oxidoreductase
MSADPSRSPVARPRSLKVGLFLPSGETMLDGGTAHWADIQAMARLAEDAGFDSLWFPDHLLMERPDGTGGVRDCWSLLAAVAAVTRKAELGPLVNCVTFRNPALLAKIADTIDEISGGRLILGLGAGWHQPEYEAFGYPFDNRFDRFEEAVSVIRTLLHEGRIDHDGAFYTLRECEVRPRGPRPGGIPILIGALASKKRMLRLIARYADLWNGWLVHSRSHPDEVAPLVAAVDAACAEAGRDPTTLGRTLGIMVDQRPAGERPPLPGSSAQPLAGTPEEIAAAIRAMAAQGISHLQVVPVIQGVAGVEAFAPVLNLLHS